MTKSETKKRIFVVVTTAHKGVFGGYIDAADSTKKILRMEEAQMCIYWTGTKGVLGLASTGPGKGCRIGPPVKAITLQDVVSVTEANKEAEVLWQQQPWN